MPNHPVTNFLSLFSALSDTTEDRTVAICCGAYLEDTLASTITLKLPGLNKDLFDRLMGDKGPLNPVSARIDLARALNVIDGDDRNLLIQIVRIRNRFAHNISVNSFDHADVAKIIDDKMQLGGRNKAEYVDSYSDAARQTRRERFMYISMMIGVRLSNFVSEGIGHGKITRTKRGSKDQTNDVATVE